MQCSGSWLPRDLIVKHFLTVTLQTGLGLVLPGPRERISLPLKVFRPVSTASRPATQTTRDALDHRDSSVRERASVSPIWKDRLLNSFTDFGLAEPILRALAQENYVTPTPIQAQTIPSALTGRDVVGI